MPFRLPGTGPAEPERPFARVADKLTFLELQKTRSEDLLGEERFLDYYGDEGILLALKAYGIHDQLVRMGLQDYQVISTREDRFHHRLQMFLGDARDDDHRIMDMRVHLRTFAPPANDADESAVEGAPSEVSSFEAMFIEWLSMQNPRASFTKERPRLPGQRHPSTGLGRTVHNLLIVIAQRIGREAIVNVPERFHLARLYDAGGYRYFELWRERELHAVLDALKPLGFAAAAWAVERGFLRVHDDDLDEDSPWSYAPAEMVLPISERFSHLMPSLLDRVADRLVKKPLLELHLDIEGLRRSLRDDPVEGLDPDDLSR